MGDTRSDERQSIDEPEQVNGPEDRSPHASPSDGVASNEGRVMPSTAPPGAEPGNLPPAERPEEAGSKNAVLDNVTELERNADGTLVNDTEEEKQARRGQDEPPDLHDPDKH